jgi:multisubunit Na+/H+ antiporter MnhG subunit
MVLLLGLGVGALGLIEADMYTVGAELLLIGAIGLMVRAPDVWRSLRR